MLEKLLKSNAEVKVLGVVLFTEGLHLREIARRALVSSFEAKRELDNLVELGILKSERRGNQLLFKLNPSCPFLPDLKSLYLKTEGLFSQLREALQKLPGIKYAFVYGSYASREAIERSDLDLLVIGSVSEGPLSNALFAFQKSLSTEINFILWTERDFHSKLPPRSAFIRSVLSNPRAWLLGDEDEFGRIAKKAVGGKS